jgi:hypothetical protein
MRMVYWVLNLGHPLLRQEKMGVNEEQGRGFSCRGATFRACFPWQPQLSKKRDFLPIMFPRDFVQYSPLPLLSGKRKKTFPKLLSGLGNARGTDGFRVLCHQFFPSSLPRLAPCISGFKNVCQRAQAFTSQLLPLQRLCHLPSKYHMLFLQVTDFRTEILSSQYRRSQERVDGGTGSRRLGFLVALPCY